ncbi:MAG: 1-phosphofructokinase [Oscillospiraceae bacterium]|nr:1-phosphofructokinase [Oscillospiraceae bacterium]
MIITVTLNPALDKSVVIENFGTDKVNRITDMRFDAGGKGINVSKVVHTLGGDTLALGVLGGTIGEYIMSSLNRMQIPHDFVHVQSETRTNLKIYDPASQVYTDINEPGFALPDVRLTEIETKLFYYAKKGDYVVFAGGAPIGVPDSTVANWTRRLNELGARVVADLDGELLRQETAARPFLIKPNLAEFQRLCRLADTTLPSLTAAARRLVSRGVRNVVVSLGPQGALFVNGKQAVFAKAPLQKAKSTVGAGDAMTAALVYALNRNQSWRDAIVLSMATATAKVTCAGNTPPPVEKINSFRSQIAVTELSQPEAQ